MFKVIVFDAYGTAFDTESSFEPVFTKHFTEDGKLLFALWKQKYFEYVMTQSHFPEITNYKDVVSKALLYVLKANGCASVDVLLADVLDTFSNLSVFQDFKDLAKGTWFDRIYVYSNATQQMLDALKANITIESKDKINFLSTENGQSFKPSPRSYAFLKRSIWYPEKEIMYVSANKWDVIGAKCYGFATCWLNRNNEDFDDNLYIPDHIITNARDIRAIVAGGH